MKRYAFNIKDVFDDDKSMCGYVGIHNDCIVISINGTGMLEMEEGFSEVIAIELMNGKPRVICWNDINSPDPVTVELDQALESERINRD